MRRGPAEAARTRRLVRMRLPLLGTVRSQQPPRAPKARRRAGPAHRAPRAKGQIPARPMHRGPASLARIEPRDRTRPLPGAMARSRPPPAAPKERRKAATPSRAQRARRAKGRIRQLPMLPGAAGVDRIKPPGRMPPRPAVMERNHQPPAVRRERRTAKASRMRRAGARSRARTADAPSPRDRSRRVPTRTGPAEAAPVRIAPVRIAPAAGNRRPPRPVEENPRARARKTGRRKERAVLKGILPAGRAPHRRAVPRLRPGHRRLRPKVKKATTKTKIRTRTRAAKAPLPCQ